MKITVVDAGYVGLSKAVLMAQQHSVILSDISVERVDLINQGSSAFFDAELGGFLATKQSNLQATLSKQEV